MFEIGDYVIFNNEIVRILEVKVIKGQNLYKVSGKYTSFNESELSVIKTTPDNYDCLYAIMSEDFLKNGNIDVLYLHNLKPQNNMWVDDELNVKITSYQDFKDFCKKQKMLIQTS